MPKSAWGCALAQRTTSGNQGQGTITLAEVTQPFSKASKVARFTEWAMPKSSAWMMSSLAEAGYPSFSCRVGVAGEVCAAADANKTRLANAIERADFRILIFLRRAYGTWLVDPKLPSAEALG